MCLWAAPCVISTVNVSQKDASRKTASIRTSSSFLGIGGMPTAVPTAARRLEKSLAVEVPTPLVFPGNIPRGSGFSLLTVYSVQLLTQHSLLTTLLGHPDQKPPGHVFPPSTAPSAFKPPFPVYAVSTAPDLASSFVYGKPKSCDTPPAKLLLAPVPQAIHDPGKALPRIKSYPPPL